MRYGSVESQASGGFLCDCSQRDLQAESHRKSGTFNRTMRCLFFALCLLMLPIVSALDCGLIEKNAALASDIYCPSGFTLGEGVRLQCNGNTIAGDNAGVGVSLKDNASLLNCNLINFFTGISVVDTDGVEVRDVLIANVSTGIDARGARAQFTNVRVRDARYFGVYLKNAQLNLSRTVADLTQVIDDRAPKESVVAEEKNYTFREPAIALRARSDRILLDKLNLSWDDHLRSNVVRVNATVVKEEQRSVYTIDVETLQKVDNLSLYVYFPPEFSQYLMVRSDVVRAGQMLVYNMDLDNESKRLQFEVAGDVPRDELALPIVITVLRAPLRPSPDLARRIMLGLFAISALLFVMTKKFFIKEPVSPLEQFSLLLGVLALWGISYRFTIAALQMTKDFMMFMIVAALCLYYIYFIYSNKDALKKL